MKRTNSNLKKKNNEKISQNKQKEILAINPENVEKCKNVYELNNLSINEQEREVKEAIGEKKSVWNENANENEKTANVIKEEKKEENNNEKLSPFFEKEKIIFLLEEGKEYTNDLKNEINESTSDKQEKNESNVVTGNNIIKNDRNDILNDSLEYIKNELENCKENEEELEANNIMKVIMPIIQRQNRYYCILRQISKLRNIIKEFESFQSSQRTICEDKIEIEKCLIVINGMKAVIESLKSPTIINVKRKILDLIIFSLIKSNKNKFTLNKNFCPNKSFLDKILTKLQDYANKNGKTEEKKDKINKKIEFIHELIEKNNTIINFPFS